MYPGYKSFIGRQELKRLMQSTFQTWIKVCKYHKVPESAWKLNGQYNYIEFQNGSRIDLLDLKFQPADPLYERFGSLEYTDSGAIEEAGEVHFLAYDVLKSRGGRHMNDEYGIHPSMLVTGNPKKNWTYRVFYKPFKNGKLPNNLAFIQSLYQDNPYTAKVYGKQLDGISDAVLRKRLKDGIWEYDEGDGALMSYDQITDIFTNTAEKDEEKYLIVDAARFGSDRIVLTLWKGLHCYRVIIKTKQGTEKTEEDIKQLARDEKIPYSHILIDEDGIGGGILDHLSGAKGFSAQRVPFENKQLSTQEDHVVRENYDTLKDQCAYELGRNVRLHKISCSIEDEKVKEDLIEELQQIKRADPDKEGKLKIISKEEVKEAIGRSPDISDTFLMRMYFLFKDDGPTSNPLSTQKKKSYK